MSAQKWIPVSKREPCALCGRDHWCMVSPDGTAQLCHDTQSDRPAPGGGWIHGLKPAAPAPSRPERRAAEGYDAPDFDAALWWQTVRHVGTWDRMEVWATRLGLPIAALDVMGACVLGEMLTFPMHNGLGRVCGIRTRNPDGSKRAVTGSRAGVFLPTFHDGAEPLVCEGPTDATAALELGYYPIGRPSCSGCERHVVDTCRRQGIERVTVCADSDGPGITGARKLTDVLRAARIGVRMVTAGGHKDLRDWFKAGATRQAVDSAWSQTEWRT